MTNKQFEELKQVIYTVKNCPVQNMKCLVCDYCDIYKEFPLRAYCRFHDYDLLDYTTSVCFNFRPLRK